MLYSTKLKTQTIMHDKCMFNGWWIVRPHPWGTICVQSHTNVWHTAKWGEFWSTFPSGNKREKKKYLADTGNLSTVTLDQTRQNQASNNYRRHICTILLSVFGACEFPWHKLRLLSWKLHLAQSCREQSSPWNLPNKKHIIILYTTLINNAQWKNSQPWIR